MTTHLLVDKDGTVVNGIMWDGKADWRPPDGLAVVECKGGWRDGWKWDWVKKAPYDPADKPADGGPVDVG